MIIARLDRLENNMRDDIGRVHDKIEAISNQGCAHRADHVNRVEALSARVAANEKWRYKQAGAIAGVSTAGGVAGFLLAWLGRVFLHRLGNGQ